MGRHFLFHPVGNTMMRFTTLVALLLWLPWCVGCLTKPAPPPVTKSPAKAPAPDSAPTGSVPSPDFMLVAYNVENLFDIDGIAIFDDYAPETYGPRQFLVKLRNIATVLGTLQEGRGPEI